MSDQTETASISKIVHLKSGKCGRLDKAPDRKQWHAQSLSSVEISIKELRKSAKKEVNMTLMTMRS